MTSLAKHEVIAKYGLMGTIAGRCRVGGVRVSTSGWWRASAAVVSVAVCHRHGGSEISSFGNSSHSTSRYVTRTSLSRLPHVVFVLLCAFLHILVVACVHPCTIPPLARPYVSLHWIAAFVTSNTRVLFRFQIFFRVVDLLFNVFIMYFLLICAEAALNLCWSRYCL